MNSTETLSPAKAAVHELNCARPAASETLQ